MFGSASRIAQPLSEHVERAWQAFDRFAGRPWCVTPAAPILFFGDLKAYRNSPLRLLTVGLNPSLKEFPARDPFRRFPLLESSSRREPSRYIKAMSAYFRRDPYRSWFSSFEPLLNGMKASYYGYRTSTALQTDICSPVATNPTWSGLGENVQSVLMRDGGPLWHKLLEELRPQIVAISVAQKHLKRIKFPPRTRWKVIHTFRQTSSGAPRSRPYELYARWYNVGGQRSLFLFGAAAQTPFALLSANQKRRAGEIALKTYQDGA